MSNSLESFKRPYEITFVTPFYRFTQEFHGDCDANGDGLVTLDEFVSAISTAKAREAKRAAKAPEAEVHLSSAVQQFNLPPYLLIKVRARY